MYHFSSSAPGDRFAGVPAGPRLLVEVRDAAACLALELDQGRISHVHVLPCRDHATLHDAIRAYLGYDDVAAAAPVVRQAAIAIANCQAVAGDQVPVAHAPWSFSVTRLREECDFEALAVVGGFAALARALPLPGNGARRIGGGRREAGAPLGLVCAGSRLGVSGVLPAKECWTVLDNEGGLISFSPVNEIEIEILRLVRREFGYVSAERLMSTSGIELIYRSLATLRDVPAENLTCAQVIQQALGGACLLCDETIETFCAMLGTVAGNLAVTLGARGGVYIGGGIVAALGDRFDRSAFRARFENKGRFNAYLGAIPTHVITDGYAALAGASAILAERLARR